MKYNWQTHLLELDPYDYESNFLEIEGEEYYLENLDLNFQKAKGGNSSLFRLVSASDPEISFAIKFCRSPIESFGREALRKNRFLREIDALKKCKASGLQNTVVCIERNGLLQIGTNANLPYYVMEEAECDLAQYLEDEDLSQPEKLALCKRILDSLQKLHEIGIYHRDIKPDNILYIGNYWKLADLGLINYRDEDLKLDKPKERIGPFGYYSPEAINFGLSLRKSEDGGFLTGLTRNLIFSN